jgi:hypothetical protein
MASYEMTGVLKIKGETQNFPSGFSKRPFVITTQEQYPQDVQFELTKNATGYIDRFNEGEMLKVTFDIRGREYNGKYFVNLNAYRVDKAEGAMAPPAAAPAAQQSAPQASAPRPAAPAFDPGLEPISGDVDDLPF